MLTVRCENILGKRNGLRTAKASCFQTRSSRLLDEFHLQSVDNFSSLSAQTRYSMETSNKFLSFVITLHPLPYTLNPTGQFNRVNMNFYFDPIRLEPIANQPADRENETTHHLRLERASNDCFKGTFYLHRNFPFLLHHFLSKAHLARPEYTYLPICPSPLHLPRFAPPRYVTFNDFHLSGGTHFLNARTSGDSTIELGKR